MRILSPLTLKAKAARAAIGSAILAPFFLPGSASAASVKVCAAAGDACSKFMDKYVNPVITLLSIIVGVAAVASYIIAAIQYSSAGDDPGAVSKAKNRAFKTTIGLIGYLFFFSFLNYIVPGGLF
jgi:hypothetical protein